jgi:hypothetical protein
MSFTRAWEPRVGDAFGLALLDYLEHGSEARSHFIERDDGLLETIDTGALFTQESETQRAGRAGWLGVGGIPAGFPPVFGSPPPPRSEGRYLTTILGG